jgi:hypothetical protein
MSPRAGGEAAKFGDRFEGRWTVSWMIEVLYERADAIMVETIDELRDSVEFEVRRDGRTIRHQAKRQHGQDVNWTGIRLAKHGILEAAQKNIAAGHEFFFVSTIPAVPLEQLVDMARRADDEPAFAAQLSQTASTVSGMRNQLMEQWDMSSGEVLTVLRSMHIEKPSEEQLRRVNAALCEVIIEGPGAATAATLAEIAEDNLGRTLTATVIWRELEQRGLHQVALHDVETVAARTGEATGTWRRSVTREHLEPAIARAETQTLSEHLRAGPRLILLTGSAGSGKSGVAEQTLDSMAALGWTTLGFRLDRRRTAITARQLGEQLDLPASPVLTLAQAAQGEDALLVVDQLDAVSMASGRLAELFDVVDEMLQQAATFPNIRVVLACRSFDVQADPRLRDLARREDVTQAEVGALSEAEVADAVAQMGLEPSSLTAAQRSLLRSPFNLVLLHAIRDEPDRLQFASIDDLLDAYWDRKRRDCAQGDRDVRFEQVIGALVGAMSDSRQLDVPLNVLDGPGLRRDADVMASAHVVVADEHRIAFFHESFFDYAFARLWMSAQQSLVEFLVSGEQGLFRRAQVRQVLVFLRERDAPRYQRELDGLLTDDRVRFHIKHVVLAVLRATANPTVEELSLLRRILDDEPAWSDQIELLWRTSPWFDLIDSRGLIESWLGQPTLAPRALELMLGAVKDRPGRIAEILGARTGDADFPSWFRWLGRWAPFEADRRLFELLMASVKAGIWDGHEHELWLYSHALADDCADWCVELLFCWLTRHPDQTAGQANVRIADLEASDRGLTALTTEAARKAPAAFCDTLVPWMLSAMAVAEDGNDWVPITDRHFGHRVHGAHVHDLADALLAGAAQALELLAGDGGEPFERQIDRLAADRHDGAQFLLYKALAASDDTRSDRAGAILLEGEYRFRCGYHRGDGSVTREMLQARAPAMSSSVFEEVEAAIIAYEPASERLAGARQWRGSARLALLDALPADRLSPVGRRTLGELQRKLGSEIPKPFGIVTGYVKAPIGPEACRRMSDDQWIGAIRRHASHEGDERRWELIGGAEQLSSHLEELTKEDPVRFARLGLRLTGDDNHSYLGAILRGLGNAGPIDDTEPIFELIRHAAQIHDDECDRWLSWPLRQLPDEAVPIDVVELLITRARHSPDPNVANAPDATDSDRDLEMVAINSVRGATTQVLGDMVIRDAGMGERSELIATAAPALAEDPNAAVRTCVAHLLHALLPTRPALVRGLLPSLLAPDDAMLASRSVEGLMAAVAVNHFDDVRDLITRMLTSERADVRQAGGRLQTWAAVAGSDNALLAATASHPSDDVRTGAAQVISGQVRVVADRQALVDALTVSLDDPEPAVHDTAGHFITQLREANLDSWRELVLALINSRAFEESIPQLAITLEGASGDTHELVVAAGRRFVDVHGSDLANIATGAAGDAKQIGELVLRAERRATEPARNTEVLDVIDSLLLHGAYGFADALTASERSV